MRSRSRTPIAFAIALLAALAGACSSEGRSDAAARAGAGGMAGGGAGMPAGGAPFETGGSGGVVSTGGIGGPPVGGAGGSLGGAGGGAGAPPSWIDGGEATVAVAPLAGPTYLGSLSNGPACATSYPTSGHAPTGAGPFPLFLYFVGTEFVPGNPADAHDNPAAVAVTEAMARRGFVALSADYDNDLIALLSDHQSQLACLFDAQRPDSLIAQACALSTVDCGLGIAAWGHSQGGFVAVVAHDWDPRVRAAWATGYGGDGNPTLDRTRLRVVNGEADASDNGTAAKLQTITGLTAGECPDPDQCLRVDGSGYVIVRAAALENPGADGGHCWFDRATCAGEIMLEPTWVDPLSDEAYAIAPNADWLAGAATR